MGRYADLVYISLFFGKAELGKTLVFHIPQQVLLEQLFDNGILEGGTLAVIRVQTCDIVVIKQVSCKAWGGVARDDE